MALRLSALQLGASSMHLDDRVAADKLWNEEPFAKNGGYQSDSRITRRVFGDRLVLD